MSSWVLDIVAFMFCVVSEIKEDRLSKTFLVARRGIEPRTTA